MAQMSNRDNHAICDDMDIEVESYPASPWSVPNYSVSTSSGRRTCESPHSQNQLSVEQSEPDAFEYMSDDDEKPMSVGTFNSVRARQIDTFTTHGTGISQGSQDKPTRSSASTSRGNSTNINGSTGSLAAGFSAYLKLENVIDVGTDEDITPWAVPNRPQPGVENWTRPLVQTAPKAFKRKMSEQPEAGTIQNRPSKRNVDTDSQTLSPQPNGFSLKIIHQGSPKPMFPHFVSNPQNTDTTTINSCATVCTDDQNKLCNPPSQATHNSPISQCDQEDGRLLDFNVSHDLVNALEDVPENSEEAAALYNYLPPEMQDAVEKLQNVQFKNCNWFTRNPGISNGVSQPNLLVNNNQVQHVIQEEEELEQAVHGTQRDFAVSSNLTNAVLPSGGFSPQSSLLTIPLGRTESPARSEMVRLYSQRHALLPPSLDNVSFPREMNTSTQCQGLEDNSLNLDPFRPGPSGCNRLLTGEPVAKQYKPEDRQLSTVSATEGACGSGAVVCRPAKNEILSRLRQQTLKRRQGNTELSESDLQETNQHARSYEMTAEEIEARNLRRDRNKESARKSRKRNKDKESQNQKEQDELSQRRDFLRQTAQRLEEEKIGLLRALWTDEKNAERLRELFRRGIITPLHQH